jgi:hypothetical protein
VSKKTIGLFITLLIFSALTALFYRLYGNADRKMRELIQVDLENEKAILAAYIKDNEESIKSYSKEIDATLCNYYHFKEGYRPETLINSSNNYPNIIDIKLHKERKTAQVASKIIYNTVVSNGDDGNPDIFNNSYSTKTLPRFYILNKAIFGSYNPSTKTVIALSSIFLLLGLIYYGIPTLLLGPNHDVFITSKEWKDIANPMIWALTIIFAVPLFRSKEYKQGMAIKYGQTNGIILKKFIIPMMFFALYCALQIGAGKALNDAFGTEQNLQMFVTKDPDTRKRAGKNYTDAYCVKINATLDSPTSSGTYCIKKEHYDKLPDSSPVMMKFHGTKSFFGFRIDGYYEGYQNTHQA